MKKNKGLLLFWLAIFIAVINLTATAQTKPKVRYDTVIVKHVTAPAKKTVKPKPAVPQEIILPTPEYINQPYYFDKDGNKLIKLENANALLMTKKKTLGLKGAKQFLSMDAPSSKIRFIAKKEIVFFIKTSGDVIDLTSYIKLYQFIPVDQKREVTVNAKEGLLSDKDEARGKLMSFSVKMLSKDNYQVQLPEQLEAGEYGFIWVKNMELKEFTVFAFGIDWRNSD
ncbi:hypothetical protein [Ferruginibacter sp.]|nr:hypothetical protein [Ferruginibacter sp.]